MSHIISITSNLETYKNFTADLVTNRDKLEKLCKIFDKIKPFSISLGKMLDIGKIMKINYEIFVDNDIKKCVDYSFGFNSFYEQVDHLKQLIDSGKINMCSFIDASIEEAPEEEAPEEHEEANVEGKKHKKRKSNKSEKSTTSMVSTKSNDTEYSHAKPTSKNVTKFKNLYCR